MKNKILNYFIAAFAVFMFYEALRVIVGLIR